MNKTLKWALILTPVAIGGVVVYVYLKKSMVPGKTLIKTNPNGTIGQGQAQASDQEAGVSTAAINSQYFPLKVGSNNKYVGELQDVLGVTIDNKFGTQTQAALQEQAGGLTQVTNLDQLNSVEDQILAHDQTSDTVANNAALSQSLVTQYQNSLSGSMMAVGNNLTTTTDTTWFSVQQDPASGNWIKTDSQISLKAGTNLGTKYYQPSAVDGFTGNLIVNCTGGNILSSLFGSNIGYWMADPNALILN